MDWRDTSEGFPAFPAWCCVVCGWFRFSIFFISSFSSAESAATFSTHNTNSSEEMKLSEKNRERRAYHYWVGIVIVCPAKLRDFSLLARMFVHFLEKKTSTSGFHNFRHVLFSIALWTPKCLIFSIFFFSRVFLVGLSLPNSCARKVSETKDYFRRFWLPVRWAGSIISIWFQISNKNTRNMVKMFNSAGKTDKISRFLPFSYFISTRWIWIQISPIFHLLFPLKSKSP